jgi:hypothetical protein
MSTPESHQKQQTKRRPESRSSALHGSDQPTPRQRNLPERRPIVRYAVRGPGIKNQHAHIGENRNPCYKLKVAGWTRAHRTMRDQLPSRIDEMGLEMQHFLSNSKPPRPESPRSGLEGRSRTGKRGYELDQPWRRDASHCSSRRGRGVRLLPLRTCETRV